jgi:hypothetical protein
MAASAATAPTQLFRAQVGALALSALALYYVLEYFLD